MLQFAKLMHLRGAGHAAMHCNPGGMPVPLGGYGPFEKADDVLNTASRFRALQPRRQIQHKGRAPGILTYRQAAHPTTRGFSFGDPHMLTRQPVVFFPVRA
jgi:hypothetical protein